MTKQEIRNIYNTVLGEFQKKKLKHTNFILRELKIRTGYRYSDQELYDIVHNIETPLTCPVCGKKLKIQSFTKGYSSVCGNICHNEYRIRQRDKKLIPIYDECIEKKLNVKDIIKKYNLNTGESKDLRIRIKNKCRQLPVCKTCGRTFTYDKNVYRFIPSCKCEIGEIVLPGCVTSNSKKSIQKQLETKKQKYNGNNSQLHLQHTENLNIEFIREHFIRDGLFYVSEFWKYFGYKSKNTRWIKNHWGITEPTYQPNVLSERKSSVEKEWLDTLDIKERQYTIFVTEGLNLTVDGYDRSTNTVYEFLGDFWHGNPETHPRGTFNNVVEKDCDVLYNETMKRFQILANRGYRVIYIWENDYHKKGPLAYKVFK